jgi:hypothetical protein
MCSLALIRLLNHYPAAIARSSQTCPTIPQENMLREQMGVRKLSDRRTLLPAQLPQDLGKRTLVVELDETLVHSSFQVHVLTVDRYQHSASACCSCTSRAECAYSDQAQTPQSAGPYVYMYTNVWITAVARSAVSTAIECRWSTTSGVCVHQTRGPRVFGTCCTAL